MRRGLIVATLVVLLDQASKWAIIGLLSGTAGYFRVTPFFNLVLAWNRGVSFSLLANGSAMTTWALSIFAAVVVVLLLAWLRRAQRPWIQIALGLIIGGALGNLIDRLRQGAVTDFLDFHLGLHHWPAFNVADSAIVVGVGLLMIDSLFAKPESRR